MPASGSAESHVFPGASVAKSAHPSMRIAAATHPGRAHRQHGIPCQDAVAVWRDPHAPRAAAAVADGLGSKALSQLGSRAACDAAVASLAAELAGPVGSVAEGDRSGQDGIGDGLADRAGPGAGWDAAALVRACEAARAAVVAEAGRQGRDANDLATTLQVAVLDGHRALAAMVGDGAVVAHGGDAVHVLAAPPEGRYANEVVPLTATDWRDELQTGELVGARSVLLFTDGLTRLLLAKPRGGAWQPFAPFFDAFLPQLAAPRFDDRLAEAFVGSAEVDRSWDDDKGLAVLAHDPSFVPLATAQPAAAALAAEEPGDAA